MKKEKYAFHNPPKDMEARMAALGDDFLNAVMQNTMAYVLANKGALSLQSLAAYFSEGFLYGQQHALEKPKKKKVPTEV